MTTRNIQIEEVYLKNKNKIFKTEQIAETKPVCCRCSGPVKPTGRWTIIKLYDGNFDLYPVYLSVHCKIWHCATCKTEKHTPLRTKSPIPCRDGNSRMTLKGVRSIYVRAHELDLKSTTHVVGLSQGTICNQRERAYEAIKELQLKTPHPPIIGMDHIFMRGQYRTMIVDILSAHVDSLLPTINGPIVDKDYLSRPGRLDVEIVSIDQSRHERKLAQSIFPNATIVSDPFHLIHNVGMHLINATTPKFGEVSKASNGGLANNRNGRCKFYNLIRANYEDLTDEDKVLLNSLLDRLPWLSDMYSAYADFGKIFCLSNAEDAEENLNKWIEVTSQVGDAKRVYKPSRTSLKQWKSEVIASLHVNASLRADHGISLNSISTAKVEAFNGVARKIIRNANGISFEGLERELLMRHSIFNSCLKALKDVTQSELEGEI